MIEKLKGHGTDQTRLDEPGTRKSRDGCCEIGYGRSWEFREMGYRRERKRSKKQQRERERESQGKVEK